MHPHRKESIPHYYYILTSYDSSTLTTTITMDDEEDANAKMFYMASMSTWLQVTYFLFRWKYIPQKMQNWDSE